jgi:hypothetical protein
MVPEEDSKFNINQLINNNIIEHDSRDTLTDTLAFSVGEVRVLQRPF